MLQQNKHCNDAYDMTACRFQEMEEATLANKCVLLGVKE